MKKFIISILSAMLLLGTTCLAQNRTVNPEAKLHKYSTTIEKERPELNEATKACIAAYRRDPSAENYAALKRQVEANYDAVIARKQAKLEELRRTARDQSKVDEMQEIVNEVIADREHRIAQTMARFTDSRMRPGARKGEDGFLPLIGADENVYIAYAPVTNKEYASFKKDFAYPAGHEDYPAVNVSYTDAVAYCAWLGRKTGGSYRLPTEDEWELAAGHMPKDADFNCGEHDGLTAVGAYAKTVGASGGIDFWGNCWEWTSTVRKISEGPCTGTVGNAIKGGSWDSGRMSCRTEYRCEGRNAESAYPNLGFRIVREVVGQ